MFNHILIPLDGSDLAEAALPLALAIAERFKSDVTLLRVVRPPYFMEASNDFAELYLSLREDMRQQATAYVEAKQEALRAAGFKLHGRIVERDSVADAILDTADELGADAIAMSTHGRGGIQRWVLGSVTDKVLRHGRLPILLVRARPEKA